MSVWMAVVGLAAGLGVLIYSSEKAVGYLVKLAANLGARPILEVRYDVRVLSQLEVEVTFPALLEESQDSVMDRGVLIPLIDPLNNVLIPHLDDSRVLNKMCCLL